MKETIYLCDECKAVLNNPLNEKEHTEYLLITNGAVQFMYYAEKQKNWKSQKVDFPCQEYHFCNGKCLGKWMDKKVAETTVKIKEE